MIKACQKKILYVVGAEESMFETAYFVLRENSDEAYSGGDDILKEADRIINERLPTVKKKKKRLETAKKVLTVAVSALSGIILGGGAVWILDLLT